MSTVTTRSRLFMTAAVSMNGPAVSSRRLPRSVMANNSSATCSAPGPFCRLNSRTPATLASGANRASGAERGGRPRIRGSLARPRRSSVPGRADPLTPAGAGAGRRQTGKEPGPAPWPASCRSGPAGSAARRERQNPQRRARRHQLIDAGNLRAAGPAAWGIRRPPCRRAA